MQHEDHGAYNVVQVANAVLAAKRGDPLRSACGLEDDEVARTTVALVMLQLALELDPDFFFALRWH